MTVEELKGISHLGGSCTSIEVGLSISLYFYRSNHSHSRRIIVVVQPRVPRTANTPQFSAHRTHPAKHKWKKTEISGSLLDPKDVVVLMSEPL